ncbi:MAG: diaminopimelate epimerase [Oligoflexales bacterium]|nr:diaminopimelate epimerase [Oligoflexales bacterium]
MFINFEKWHGAKNDFILVWLSDPEDQVFESLKHLSKVLCARDGSGIGADGILVLHTKTKKDLMPERFSVINSDGSIANTCGNGIRCASLSILKRHREEGLISDLPEAINLKLLNGQTVTCRFLGKKDSEKLPYVAVEMGTTRLNENVPFFSNAKSEVERVARELSLPEIKNDFGVCEISNNHLVFFMDRVSRELARKVGPAFQKSEYWDGINTHFAAPKMVTDKDRSLSSNTLGKPINDLYEVYVWERGAGETQACGSGACAIGALLFESGVVSRSDWAGIDMPGGRLYIRQENEEDPVTMAGPGAFVFSGRVEI